MKKDHDLLILLFLIGLGSILLGAFTTGSKDLTSFSRMQEEIRLEEDNGTENEIMISNFDSEGKTKEVIFNKIPQQVIVDRVNTMETLLALGVGRSIAAASVGDDLLGLEYVKKTYPIEFSKVKKVYVRGEMDLETILALEPDCIIGWKSTFSIKRLQTTNWWSKRNVPTYIIPTSKRSLNHGTVSDECQFIEDMGKIFHKEKIAKTYIDKINDEIRFGAQAAKNTRNPIRVMAIGVQGNLFFNYDGKWLIGDIIRKLGGTLPSKKIWISQEEMIEANPDIIIVDYYTEEQKSIITQLFSAPKFNSLSAVQQHRIFMIPFGYVHSPGVRTAATIQIIRNWMYPN